MPVLTQEIKTKIASLETFRARAKAIMEQYPKGLPHEKDEEVGAILSKMSDLKEEIEGDQRLESKKAELEGLDRFINEPVHKLQHGINGDDDDRKALMCAGWEIKSGVIYAPTSLGKTVPMFGEEVLFGDIPDDDTDAAHYFKQTRAAFSPDYRKAYVKYMHTAAKTRSEGMAFTMLSPSEQKALSEGSDPGGGFLVPPDTQAEVLVRLAQDAIIRKYARVQTTSRDILQWPAVAPNTGSGSSIYSSGFVGGWVGETPAFSDTDPGFQMFQVPIRKLRVATKLSNDLVADAAANILSFMAMNGSENMALVEDSGFINGDGTPLQPTGILSSGIATVDVEGSTANTISNTTSNTGSAPKLINLAYALPAQYVSRSRFLMRRSIEGKVRKLVDASGRFMWPVATGSQFGATPRDFMGYPMDNSDFIPDDGVDANKVMIYGDIGAYVIAQRAQITSVVLRERFADTDQVGIIMFERVGGGVWNTDALRVGVV